MNPEPRWSRPAVDPVLTRDLPARSQGPKLVGNDGADLLGRLSKSLDDNSVVKVSTNPEVELDLMQRSIEDLLHQDSVDLARNVTSKVTEGMKTASKSAGSVLGSVGAITKLGVNKTASSPAWITGIAGAGGLIAGIKAVKNILKSISVMVRPNTDPKIGWLPRALMGILQGGLFFGLTSSFFGRKNLFTEHIDGKPTVRIKTLVGATLAPFLLGIFIKLGEANSIWRKVPIIGPAMQEIAETILGATREVTVATEPNTQAGRGAGVPNFQQAA